LAEKSIKPLNHNGLCCVNSLLDNIDSCSEHIAHKRGGTFNIIPKTVMLVPKSEEGYWICFFEKRKDPPTVIGGHPTNVLSRYVDLLRGDFDVLVRLTADCPNVPGLAINKAIYTLIHHRLDYISNVWEECRTAIDGHDIEVMSKDALSWLSYNAKTEDEKQHVTLAIRRQFPKELRKAALIQKEDLSHIKICIDTPDEYDNCHKRFESALNKKELAKKKGLGIYDY
jgi:spore coat polysaccharide biosynthesis protein SpsF (cytidylyltransferase family)